MRVGERRARHRPWRRAVYARQAQRHCLKAGAPPARGRDRAIAVSLALADLLSIFFSAVPIWCRHQDETFIDRTYNALKKLAGAGGFEPPYGGIKIRCLATWLRPSNRRPGTLAGNAAAGNQAARSAPPARLGRRQRIARPHRS